MSKISKPFIPVAIVLTMACAMAALVTSCNNSTDGVFIPVPKDTSALAKIDHFISEKEIREYRAAYAAENDSLSIKYPSLLLPEAEAFNKQALIDVLKDPRSVGIRIYHGVKKGGRRNEVRLIIVGVDSQGKDLLVTKGSAVAAQAGEDQGGKDHGQCPSCGGGDAN